MLKGLRVEITHIRHSYRVKGLTDRPLEVFSFDSNGVDLFIVDYLQKLPKGTNLFVGNFPFNLDNQHLDELFESIREV